MKQFFATEPNRSSIHTPPLHSGSSWPHRNHPIHLSLSNVGPTVFDLTCRTCVISTPCTVEI